MTWQLWVSVGIGSAVMAVIFWLIIVIPTDESMPMGTWIALRSRHEEDRRRRMSSNAWNIENVELSEPLIFNELADGVDLEGPEVGFDD